MQRLPRSSYCQFFWAYLSMRRPRAWPRHYPVSPPFASVVLVSLICGGVVAQNVSSVLSVGGAGTELLPKIIGSVLLLHSIGFFMGYMVPRMGLGYPERTSRTISIEVGMQNSALAVVLARAIGAHPLASLPGALSATAHSCLGSILAALWRLGDSRKKDTA